MSVINIYNRNIDEHVGEHCYYCGRGSALGNPYTHINDKKTKALYICKSRDEAIESYRHYFDCMYGTDAEFTNMFDKIYDDFKSGNDIWIGCYCHPKSCHCDILKEKLEKRLVKERFSEFIKSRKKVEE